MEAMAPQLNLSICPEDVYSSDQRAYRIYANAPISLFGIVSNLLNIVVFMDVEMRQQLVNHFLLALSISDLFLLLCNFFFLVLPVLVVETNSFLWNDLFPLIIRYSYPLALTVQTSGVYLTVLVSVHRFLGVCHPFKAKRWVTRGPVESAIIGSILFSFATNIPTWLELIVIPCFSERFNRPSRQIQLAAFHDMNYIIAKKCILYTLLMFAIPFATLITVNWKIVQALRMSSRMRSNTQQSHSLNNNIKQSSNENISRQLHLLKRTRYSEVFKSISKLSYASILKPSSELFKPKFSNSTRDRSITLMLLAIVGLFLFCNGLAFLNSVIESVMLILTESGSYEELQQNIDQSYESGSSSTGQVPLAGAESAEESWHQKVTKWFESSVEISNVLITLNSSTSTLVYLIFSSKYRMIFKSIIGLYKRDKLNRVALTTAFAARRVMELSLIPEEVESRSRRRNALAMANTTKRPRASIIRKDLSLDAAAPLTDPSKKKNKKGNHFMAHFRQQSGPSRSSGALFRDSQSSLQLSSPANHNNNSSSSTGPEPSSAMQRRTLFRFQKNSKEMFKSQGSLTNSESNLKLMDEQEEEEEASGPTPERSPPVETANFDLTQM